MAKKKPKPKRSRPMATAVLKSDPRVFHISANTPDFDPADWLIHPPGFETLFDVVPSKYWKLTVGGDDIAEMTQGEKDAVDAAEAAARTASNRSGAIAEASAVEPEGVRLRAMVELLNKRDNYLVNRVIEIQNRVQAMLTSTGAVGNMRTDGLAVDISATATRTKADAVQDYTDDINAGNQDT